MPRFKLVKLTTILVLASIAPLAQAAKVEFMGVEQIFARPDSAEAVLLADAKLSDSMPNGRGTNVALAEKLLEQAKRHLLDRNYPRIIAISDKILEIGDDEQRQKALEFAGIARERQNKFAQAIAIYEQFLSLYPNSQLADQIQSRLTGLKTMRMEPRKRLAKTRPKEAVELWDISGSLSQYYRDDYLTREGQDTEEINSALVSDINLYARKRSDKNSIVLRFDGGLVNDFIDESDDVRISRAMVQYTDDASGYQFIGGRQTRTARGVLGRFDGLVFNGLNFSSFDYSLFLGFPVQSSFDGLDSDRRFIGTSVEFNFDKKFDFDLYLLHQELDGLVDRQALGTEFQYRNEKGFFYGIFDYDFFYDDINNITAIGNYRYSERLALNLTYDYRNSPTLSTINAIQGQAVDSIEDLQALFSEDEIYQLAEDRTSKSRNLYLGGSYQIDDRRQLYLSLSLSSIEETDASGGVAASPETEDTNLSADYTIRGYFGKDDYTTFGSRLVDATSSNSVSLRFRTRFPGAKNLRYDPRVNLDFREGKTTGVDQWILKPSFKVTYKPSRKVNLEASLGIEYSNFDLPELEDQTTYNLFLGYIYQF